MSAIILNNGREKSLLRRHPWVFSEAIKHVDGKPGPGETVDVLAANGAFLGRGAYSPNSQIRVRIWSFDSAEQIAPSFFRKQIEQAVKLRNRSAIKSTAYRVVNAESDGLPGLIVDRYADFVVCQFLSCGVELWKKEIVSLIVELTNPKGIYERSDAAVRGKEGLSSVTGVLYGSEPPSEPVEIEENACRFLVDIRQGHKTGFYLDQRDNRACVGQNAVSAGAELLNCFAYTGGFGVYALKGGALRVVNVEASADTLALADRNMKLNDIDPAKVENVEGDVFQVLRRFRDSRRQFDVIVLDPPKFVHSRSRLEQAGRGYKDINMLALKLLRPGGFLFTFSCSGLMPAELFQKIVSDSALDARCEVQILKRLSQAADHPVSLNFPEGSYLKGLMCVVK